MQVSVAGRAVQYFISNPLGLRLACMQKQMIRHLSITALSPSCFAQLASATGRLGHSHTGSVRLTCARQKWQLCPAHCLPAWSPAAATLARSQDEPAPLPQTAARHLAGPLRRDASVPPPGVRRRHSRGFPPGTCMVQGLAAGTRTAMGGSLG